jgi:hypothetical protein
MEATPFNFTVALSLSKGAIGGACFDRLSTTV